MRLSPLDIKKQDFKRAMRGVDADEVQAFLQMLADQWQELLDENSRLDRRIIELESKLSHYVQVEEAMQEALKTTRQSSKQTLEAAKAKAKAIVEEAVSASTRIRKQAEDEKYALRREIERIRSRRAEVMARLRALLNSELAILEDHENQYPVVAEQDEIEELAASAKEASQMDTSESSAVSAMEQLEATVDMVESASHPEVDEKKSAVSAVEPIATVDDASTGRTTPDEDALSFDPSVTGSSDNHVADNAASQREHRTDAPAEEQARRNSPEMDKIRKILDDLA